MLDLSSTRDRVRGMADDELQVLARESLEVFVGANFAGIEAGASKEEKLLPESLRTLTGSDLGPLRDDLSFGLNSPAPAARALPYLWVAKEATARLAQGRLNFHQQLVRFRVFCIWSRTLKEKSVELKQGIEECIKRLDEHVERGAFEHSLLVQYLLEKAGIKLHYFDYKEAKAALQMAGEAAGIHVSLNGALGRRTRFQVKSVALLTLSIETITASSDDDAMQSDDTPAQQEELPPVCENLDDTLLNDIKLDEQSSGRKPLSPDQLAFVLVSGLYAKDLRLFDDLDKEEALVFMDEVIRQRLNWSIQLRALVERCVLDKENKRKVERACSQMETIVKLLDGADQVPTTTRLDYIFCSMPMPYWSVKKLHASILCSLGCISEALRTFELLEMWEDVVACYKSLNQPEKAEHIVRQLIQQHPDQPAHHCLLGDISGNTEHYERAIEVSGDRSAQARKSLGMCMLARKDHELALTHFKRSLELQCLQIGVWFNAGYCAMKLEKFSEAVTAYHRCVSLEPEHFEAWNNLAACYVNLDQKPRAQKVLQEALKLSYEHWKVWENFMIISIDIEDWGQAIAAVEKLLDLDSKRKIDELPIEMMLAKLGALVHGDGGQRNGSTQAAQEIVKRLMAVIARMASRQSLGSKITRLQAEFKRPRGEQAGDLGAWASYTQLLDSAFRKESSERKPKTEEDHTRALRTALELIDALQQMWKVQQLSPSQIAAQLKLRLGPQLRALEQQFGQQCANAKEQRLKDVYAEAASMLATTAAAAASVTE